MKSPLLLALMVGSLFAASPLFAASVEDRLMMMEKRIADLEQRVQSQDRIIQQKDAQIAEISQSMPQQVDNAGRNWFNKVEIGGLVEVEASHTSADGADDQSDLTAATVELGVSAQITDWVNGEMVALYEEETDNNGDLNIETAVLHIADPNNQWFVNAGQFILPFGVFDTHLVSDPITLDFAETLDSAIEFGIGNDNFSASAYAFQGDHTDQIDNYGLALNASMAMDGFDLNGHLGYINNLAETNSIVDGGWFNAGNESAGWVASGALHMDALSLMGEYLAATGDFADAGNDKPSAYHLEAAYHFDTGSRPATIALAYQGTDDAENANWGLDEKRLLAGISIEWMEGVSIGLEYLQAEDYAGAETDTITAQLAVEF